MEDIRQRLAEIVQGGRTEQEIVATLLQRRAERASIYAGVVGLLEQAEGLLAGIREGIDADRKLLFEGVHVAERTYSQAVGLSDTPPFQKVSEQYRRALQLIHGHNSRLPTVNGELSNERGFCVVAARYVGGALKEANSALEASGTSEPAERLNNHIIEAEASINRYAERAGLGEIV